MTWLQLLYITGLYFGAGIVAPQFILDEQPDTNIYVHAWNGFDFDGEFLFSLVIAVAAILWPITFVFVYFLERREKVENVITRLS